MNSTPGSTIAPILTDASQGLVGDLTVEVLALPEGDVLVAETTDDITEFEQVNGTSNYQASIELPEDATPGEYEIVWDDEGDRTTERLTITASNFGTPQDSDLCTVAGVQAQLQTSDDDDVEVIQELITAASATLTRWAGREFAPAGETIEDRSFECRNGLISLEPFDLREISTVTVAGTDRTGVFSPRPRTPRDGVYDRLKHTSSTLLCGEAVVAGKWGFGSIPADVTEACIITVVTWFRQDVAAFSTTFQVEDGRLTRPEAIPSAARSLLQPYKRLLI